MGIGDMTFFGAVILLWDNVGYMYMYVYVCSHAHGNKHKTFHVTCCSAGFQLYMWGHTNLCGCHICLSFPRLFGIIREGSHFPGFVSAIGLRLRLVEAEGRARSWASAASEWALSGHHPPGAPHIGEPASSHIQGLLLRLLLHHPQKFLLLFLLLAKLNPPIFLLLLHPYLSRPRRNLWTKIPLLPGW